MTGERARIFIRHTSVQVGAVLEVEPADAHHLIHVLRMKSGQNLTVISEQSAESFNAELSSDDTPVTVRILKQLADSQPRSCVKALAWALLKGAHSEQIIRQGAELGVDCLIAFQADRSLVKVKSEKDAARKVERWEKIAESAARQAQQRQISRLHVVPSLAVAIECITRLCQPDDALLFGSLEPGIAEMRELRKPVRQQAALVIGPEGDLSPRETELLRESGFEPFSMGPMRLRAETAALCAVASAHALWGFRA